MEVLLIKTKTVEVEFYNVFEVWPSHGEIVQLAGIGGCYFLESRAKTSGKVGIEMFWAEVEADYVLELREFPWWAYLVDVEELEEE